MSKTSPILAVVLTLLLCAFTPSRAAQPVTTLDQQQAIWDAVFAQIAEEPSSLSQNLRQIVPQYGYWCGMQATDPAAVPIDCVDAACREHDLSPGYSLQSPSLEQIRQADQTFIAELLFTTASTPYGELYRIEAIDLFTQKVTYEQANHVSLVVPCSDCLTGQ